MSEVIKCNCNKVDCPVRLLPLDEDLKFWKEGDAVNTEHYIRLSIKDKLNLRAWLRKQIENEIERS